MDIIKVVCGLIYKEGMFFICRRKPEKSFGGYWEFPGGKVEGDEGFEECLKREIWEELQMEIEIKSHYKTVQYTYDQFTIELISFLCDFKSCSFKLTDHDAYEWVAPNNLPDWNLAPADLPIAESLRFNLKE